MSFCYFLAIGSLPWDASCKFPEWLSLARNIIWLHKPLFSFFEMRIHLDYQPKTRSAKSALVEISSGLHIAVQAKMRIFLDYVPNQQPKPTNQPKTRSSCDTNAK